MGHKRWNVSFRCVVYQINLKHELELEFLESKIAIYEKKAVNKRRLRFQQQRTASFTLKRLNGFALVCVHSESYTAVCRTFSGSDQEMSLRYSVFTQDQTLKFLRSQIFLEDVISLPCCRHNPKIQTQVGTLVGQTESTWRLVRTRTWVLSDNTTTCSHHSLSVRLCSSLLAAWYLKHCGIKRHW